MNRWKKAFLFLLLLLSLILLSGCHGAQKSVEFAVPDQFDESRGYEITFWAKNDTNKTQVDIYNKAVSDFEKLYPNIHVTVRLYTDYNRIYNDVITNISTGTTPNVCITYPDHIATYMTGSNVMVDLDQLIPNEKYGLAGSELRFDSPSAEEVVPAFLSECVINGRHYALPFMRSTEALYINRDYVEALGYEIPEVVTWDWIWEVSEAALAKNEDGTYLLNGQNVMIPFIYKSTDNMMISALYQQNAGYATAEGDIQIFNDETGKLLREVFDHARSRAFSTFKISSYPANFLCAGQSVFAIDSTAGATWMGSEAPLSDISADQVVNFETVVRMIPQYDPAHPQMISQGPSVCVFNKEDPQEVLASWLFTQFLLTNDVQIAYSGTEGYIPVTLKAQQDPVYQDYLAREGEDNTTHYAVKIQAAKLLLDHIEDTFVTPVFNGSASLRNAAGQLVENVAKGARRKEEMSEAYLQKQYADVTSLYRLDQIGVLTGEDTDHEAEEGLPAESVALLVTLVVVWVLMLGGRGVLGWLKKKKSR